MSTYEFDANTTQEVVLESFGERFKNTQTMEIPPYYRQKYPYMAFRWCNRETLQERGGRGMRPVPRDPADQCPHLAGPDGSVRMGDMILYFMPKLHQEQRDAELKQKIARKVQSIQQGGHLASALKGIEEQRGSSAEGSLGMRLTNEAHKGAGTLDERYPQARETGLVDENYDPGKPQDPRDVLQERAHEAREAGADAQELMRERLDALKDNEE